MSLAENRALLPAIWNGLRTRCPRCGAGTLFSGYLKTAVSCSRCGLDFSGHRADDAPPYVVIFIVGHVIVGLMWSLERLASPSMWVHMAIFLPGTLLLTLALLPPVKGALVGIQWANAMHGFGDGRYEP